ncbi:MAG: hypothetical protein R3D84_15635 [Paracoccaceae bacterium]
MSNDRVLSFAAAIALVLVTIPLGAPVPDVALVRVWLGTVTSWLFRRRPTATVAGRRHRPGRLHAAAD